MALYRYPYLQRKSTVNRLTWLLILLVTLQPALANNSCKVEGYAIGFFNGVATTKKDAERGQDKIQSTLNTDEYKGEKVEYQLFYNDSYIDEGDLNLLGDFAETFDQRTHELTQKSFDRWEAFWDIINGRQESSIIQKIGTLVEGFILFVNDVISIKLNYQIKAFLEKLATLTGSTPNTEEVRLNHRLINDSLAWEGKKLIYIAHSQGNLWVNESYENVLSQTGYDADNIKVIHIAPASPIVKGDYILSGNDLVINGLQLTGIGSVQPFNFTAPVNHDESTGHGLIEVYLTDPTSVSMIKKSVKKAFSALTKPDMEDFLFQITYEYTPNFVSNHKSPQIKLVDNNEDWMDKASEYAGVYLVEKSRNKYELVSEKNFEPVTFDYKNNSRDRQTITVNQCNKISSEKPFVLGEYSEETVDLSSMWPNLPPKIETKVTVMDRFGRKLLQGGVSKNEYRDRGWSYIGSFVDFKAVIPYADTEKKQLKKNKLQGKYELYSDTILFSFES